MLAKTIATNSITANPGIAIMLIKLPTALSESQNTPKFLFIVNPYVQTNFIAVPAALAAVVAVAAFLAFAPKCDGNAPELLAQD